MPAHPKPTKKAGTITARDIVAALRKRHATYNDILITEVSCGRCDAQAWGRGRTWENGRSNLFPVDKTGRMDVLVIPRRWTKIIITAYEVKASRPDFLSDDKWPAYLPWCNKLLFAVPKGMLRDDEVADLEAQGVGVVVVSKSPRGHFTTRTIAKAAFRAWPHGIPPWDLYHTILLNKTGERKQLKLEEQS